MDEVDEDARPHSYGLERIDISAEQKPFWNREEALYVHILAINSMPAEILSGFSAISQVFAGGLTGGRIHLINSSNRSRTEVREKSPF